MRRRRRREAVHGSEWHEAMAAEPWKSFGLALEGGGSRPLSEREWRRMVMDRVTQQMQLHDSQPKRARELVAEHNVKKGLEIWRAEQIAAQASDRCSHGRWRPKCAQCVWDDDRARKAKDVDA